MRLVLPILSSTAFVLMMACSSTPGGHPHDASVTQHEAMAANEDTKASAHAAQYDAASNVPTTRCSPGRGEGGVCWSSLANPTAEHLKAAEQHRKMAADHRAASQALRDAEASACAGLGDLDRDMSPFAHREDIASVAPLESRGTGKFPAVRREGAIVTFRATPGLTAQWLQRIVSCHLARSAAMGHVMPEMPYCPLVPKDVSASVTATDTGFEVAIRSGDPEVAREISKRAEALVGR
jgi:hypothetical protein